jgi:hypothetical protein
MALCFCRQSLAIVIAVAALGRARSGPRRADVAARPDIDGGGSTQVKAAAGRRRYITGSVDRAARKCTPGSYSALVYGAVEMLLCNGVA